MKWAVVERQHDQLSTAPSSLSKPLPNFLFSQAPHEPKPDQPITLLPKAHSPQASRPAQRRLSSAFRDLSMQKMNSIDTTNHPVVVCTGARVFWVDRMIEKA